MWWCQFIDWFKFETHPSSLLNFGMAYWGALLSRLDFDCFLMPGLTPAFPNSGWYGVIEPSCSPALEKPLNTIFAG